MSFSFFYFAWVLASLQPSPATLETSGLCEDLKKAIEYSHTPEKFKKGEGVKGDMQVVYQCALTFTGAVKSTAEYWNFGKLSNVIQYFAINKPEAEAVKVFDKVAAEFKACYPDAKEEESEIGIRPDLEFQLHENLGARLLLYDYIEPGEGLTGYSVYFDLYYTGE